MSYRQAQIASLIVAVAFLGATIFASTRLWKKYIAKDRTTRRFVVAAITLFLLTSLLAQIQTFYAYGDYPPTRVLLYMAGQALLSPFWLLQNSIPLFVALWLVWRVKPLRSGEHRDFVDPRKTSPIEETVRRVFESDDFSTALRTSLPKGNKDDEYGLDYIPFMLDSLRHKRRRFDRRANIFFWVTIAVGMSFAGIITYLGYTLVNERAVGLPRDVADLREETVKIRGTLARLDVFVVAALPLKDAVDGVVRTVEGLHLNENNKLIEHEAVETLKQVKEIRQIDNAVLSMETLRARIDEKDASGKILSSVLEGGRRNLEDLAKSARSLWGEINEQTNRTEAELKRVEGFNDKDQNRVAELLKRLSIGVVVATFFFGILRYVANQFRANWQQAVRAEDEDLWLRRFYVGMKSAGTNESDRSSVISALLKGIPESTSVPAQTDDQGEKVSLDLLKELLSAISKKI